MVSRTRLILGVAALVITFIDPSEPRRLAIATYSLLVLYSGYGLLLHLHAASPAKPSDRTRSRHYWIDCGFYGLLVALSGGADSIFFTLFFFPIIVASFHRGYTAGIQVTAVSLFLFLSVGYWKSLSQPEVDLNWLLLRAMSLPVLGYMLAYRGGYELTLRKRLAFLKEIGTLSNPRLGIDQIFAANLERIRRFFAADTCLAVIRGKDGEKARLWRAASIDVEADSGPEALSPQLGDQMLLSGGRDVVYYNASPPSWSHRRLPAMSLAVQKHSADPGSRDLQEVAEFLGTVSFVSAPLRSGNRRLGRVYVARGNLRVHPEDAEFLAQIANQMMPVIENVRLVDHMAARAADEERQRIARDIHDRIIQPYIGLQLGVASMSHLFDKSDVDALVPILRERTSRLVALTETGVAELRRYISQLRDGKSAGGTLEESLRRFAERFQEATGIRIQVIVREGLTLNDRLAEELLAMVTEGISNIRRHTQAETGAVELWSTNGRLFLAIRNELGPAPPAAPFMPRSIVERAASLGGTVRVEAQSGKETEVLVDIPL